MPRNAALLALACASLLLAACGKGNPTAARTTPTHAPAGAGTGKTASALTRAQALAYAHAVNLREEDVPGFHASVKTATPKSKAEQRAEGELLSCLGAPSAAGEIAEVPSQSFSRKRTLSQLEVSSTVSVARTEAEAAQILSALRGADAKSCLTRYFDRLFRGPSYHGAAIGRISVASGSPPAPGMAGSFGLRLTVSLIVRTIPIPFYLDILGFVSGRAEVSLISSGVPLPFPAAGEEHLFTTLLDRAREHHI